LNVKLMEKLKEALASVLPITVIVALISLFITPISTSVMMMFLLGAVLLIFGIGLFSLGAEKSMGLIGERIGAGLTKSKKIWIIAFISFVVGTIITVAEPDLQVLANQIPSIPNIVLLTTVGVGVGLFLALAMLRIVFKVRLSRLLVVLYFMVFILSFFVPSSFLPLSFDAGGVTTGPLTVPFIIALGIGAASVRGDKNSESDSFGLVALCSVGPILAVMILGLVYKVTNTNYIPIQISNLANTKDVGQAFVSQIPYYAKDVLKSLLPLIVFFVLYNVISLRLQKQELKKIFFGFVFTFIGLVVFLTGVNVGFLPVGNILGVSLAELPNRIIVLPIIMAIGFFIVKAEPAVQILVKKVNEITDGMVSENVLQGTLSVGMMLALIISLLRALYGIPFFYIILPGYALALILTFFTPDIFVGVAFDSGGVTSGPMTASFLLPLMIGICEASSRANINVMEDAFGLVSMVALMPLITIQIVGIMYKYRKDRFFEEQVVTKVEEHDDIVVFPRKQQNA